MRMTENVEKYCEVDRSILLYIFVTGQIGMFIMLFESVQREFHLIVLSLTNIWVEVKLYVRLNYGLESTVFMKYRIDKRNKAVWRITQ